MNQTSKTSDAAIGDSPRAERFVPSNRELKVRRGKPAFGRHEVPKISRRPRPEPAYKLYHRKGRQNPAKIDARVETEEELRYWIEKLERRRIVEEARRLDKRTAYEERTEKLEEYVRQQDYLIWWEDCNGYYSESYDSDWIGTDYEFDELFDLDSEPGFECDCPACTGIDYAYDEPFYDFEDLYPDPGYEPIELPLESSATREPMYRGEESPSRSSKRPGTRALRRARARRRNRLAPAKRAWAG